MAGLPFCLFSPAGSRQSPGQEPGDSTAPSAAPLEARNQSTAESRWAAATPGFARQSDLHRIDLTSLRNVGPFHSVNSPSPKIRPPRPCRARSARPLSHVRSALSNSIESIHDPPALVAVNCARTVVPPSEFPRQIMARARGVKAVPARLSRVS